MYEKVYKYLLRFVLFVLTVIVLYFLLGALFSRITTNPPAITCPEKKEIFISTNGVHLDIITPRSELSENFINAIKGRSGATYFAFGWGDKGFYLETPTWKELKLSVAIRALILKSETAMHVTNYGSRRDKWIPLSICPSQFAIILEHITTSFELNVDKKVIEIPDAGYTKNDNFFEANGNYNAIHTCNNWVNDALKKAQIKTAIWAPFDKGVLRHLD